MERRHFSPFGERNRADGSAPQLNTGHHVDSPHVQGFVFPARAFVPSTPLQLPSGIDGIFAAQLQIMAKQLELLGARTHDLLDHGIANVTLETGDAARGWDRHGPYDVIAITGSVPVLDDQFLHQLKPGGRLLAVVGDEPIMRVERHTCVAAGEFASQILWDIVAPRLHGFAEHPSFSF